MATVDQTPARDVIRLREIDNVAVAATPIPRGSVVSAEGASAVEALDPIRPGHKIALERIPEGASIRKYGQVIGTADREIPAGAWVHVHNVRVDAFERDHAYATERPEPPRAERLRTFMGFPRADGRVGTRNQIAIISTVNCSASVSKSVADRFRDGRWRADFPNVDDIFAITHKGGCGLPFEGPDHQLLERVLAGFATHPNVGAYVIIGLGCEVGYADHLVESSGLVAIGGSRAGSRRANGRPAVMNIQEQGGITRTVERAVEAVHQLLPVANAATRTEQPASALRLGLECGGSDGSSGVTANPALGVAADLLVAQGGTAVLAETPEIYGAEHLLTKRAVDESVGRKLVERIRWWEWYTGLFGAQINNNPSPGNKEGGLTTIYEKSLGAVAKGGSTALVDVVGYAERVNTPGLVVMDTPGYDPVSLTGLVAGGCNLLTFTTGRGSVSGLKPAPCVKIATNTTMYERLKEDMDLNAGTILDGEPVDAVGARLFELLLEVAGGRTTAAERNGVGEEEFAPWQIGPTL